MHPFSHGSDDSGISVDSGVVSALISLGVSLVGSDFGPCFAALASDFAEVAVGFAIGRRLGGGEVVRRKNHSDWPIVVIVANFVGVFEQSHFKGTMGRRRATLHKDASLVVHVSRGRPIALLIMIIILNNLS